MAFEHLLDPIFSPLLDLPPLAGIAIFAFIVSLITTLIQKYATDQNRLKHLKEEMKDIQKRAKELQKTNPDKAMEVHKESMNLTGEMMRHSMKSMMYTFIPIILIFSWMGANLAYNPIMPDHEFEVTILFEKGTQGSVTIDVPDQINVVGEETKTIDDKNMASWKLKGESGEYLIEFNSDFGSERKVVLITNEQAYAKKDKTKPYFTLQQPSEGFIDKNSKFNKISLNYDKKIYINILGGHGWLFSYIILSILFSIVIRKIVKVY